MAAHSPANSVRIIGGEHRSRKITFQASKEDTSLRPSGNRVRECLFNWLNFSITRAQVLDVFAGSGVLGFEALSRGAKETIFLEKNAFYIKQLQKNSQALKCDSKAKIVHTDALGWLEQNKHSLYEFDLIFLDPPFSHPSYYQEVLDILATNISQECLVYVEYAKGFLLTEDNAFARDWKMIKSSTMANVSLALISRAL